MTTTPSVEGSGRVLSGAVDQLRTMRHAFFRTTIAVAVVVNMPGVFAAEVTQAQAVARSEESSTSQSSSTPIVLEAVTVTARKTTERLQDVPVSITVLPAETLKETPFDPGAAIARNAPNVQWVNRTTGSQWFSIRGISSLGSPANYSDGTIGFNVDGVPTSMMGASNVLLDVDHVEVLRGPQGTLWGTNALGGAINVITNQPDGTHDVRVTTEMGEDGYRMGEAIIGDNLIPNVLDGRMAIRFGHEDGDISSVHTDKLGERDIGAFRGGLRFTGWDDTTVTLTGNYLHDEANAPLYLLRNGNHTPKSGILTEPDSTNTQVGTNLTIEHFFDHFKLTSVSAYQYNELESELDGADSLVYGAVGLPASSSVSYLTDKENTVSQELRLSSLEGEPIRWVVGTSAMHTDGTRVCQSTQCAPVPFSAITMTSKLDTLSLGLFGDVSIPFAERWELSMGARVSHDDIEMKRHNSLGLASLTGSNSTAQTYLTGRMALAYKWTDDIQTYVSVARGHASRVYPLFSYPVNGVEADPYPAATDWTYEAGIKAALLDDRLQLDASVYYNDVKNGVMSYLDPALGAFRTAYQDYKTKGFELQGRAIITDGLSFNGGLGYTHSSLGSNGAATNTVSGNPVPNTPEWTATAGPQYETSAQIINLPGMLSFNMQYQYTGKRTADIDKSFYLDPYSIVNTRLGWKDKDLEVYLFGRNLFDKRYETFGSVYGGLEIVSVGRGRTLGVGLTKSF
ncbi:outer membrane receptor protein [Pseudomonas sp. GM102]|uniref:TonB-dependent receptor n=1 Tax=Pseudomonas sp. GM102 TaxID=1144321 RepID=UPI00026F6F15|nr:TonB-dependent receptor [Pseudomonas sp. GM102]EJM00309.1 outer membrane receptor protein [Pseudomonas sp. GM102]